ncbi:MAG: CsbD family protein [Anaerolineales bacterium]
MDLSTLFKSQWNQLRGKAKEKWGKLTDDDLDRVEGKVDQLIGVLQEKYELTRAKAETQVNEFLTSK